MRASWSFRRDIIVEKRWFLNAAKTSYLQGLRFYKEFLVYFDLNFAQRLWRLDDLAGARAQHCGRPGDARKLIRPGASASSTPTMRKVWRRPLRAMVTVAPKPTVPSGAAAPPGAGFADLPIAQVARQGLAQQDIGFGFHRGFKARDMGVDLGQAFGRDRVGAFIDHALRRRGGFSGFFDECTGHGGFFLMALPALGGPVKPGHDKRVTP